MATFHPFVAIAVDLYSPGYTTPQGYRYILTVVDLCTRWVTFLPIKSKFPAEVMATLCTQWLHIHGVPSCILSDRGKEFLGVMTTVCHVLDIRHVKTTPYHPRTNGLCEGQHKMITSELKIRSARPSAPHWCALTTEVSFTHNITPIQDLGSLSPFNLVFGRSPRLAPKDFCFPAVKPSPLLDSHDAAQHV